MNLYWIPPFRLMRTSASLPRRVWLPLKLVSSFVILTALPKWRASPGARYCVSWRLMVCFLFLRFPYGGLNLRLMTVLNLFFFHFMLYSGLAPEIPEDLYHLIKKAVSIRKHLERNRKDKDSKFRLILVESRIHRLARYYKKTKKLPPVWK